MLADHGQQGRHRGPGIAQQGQCCGAAGQLGGIDVDADLAGQIGEVAVVIHVILGRAELGADRQQLIGRGQRPAHRLQAGRGGHAQRMAMQHAARIDRLDHRRVQLFGQGTQGGLLPLAAATGQNDHAAGSVQPRCGGGKVGGWWQHRHGQRHRCGQFGAGQRHHVGRHLDMDRTGPAGLQQPKSPVQHRPDILRCRDLPGRAQGAHHGGLIGQFVQQAQPLAQRCPAVHPGNHQHRDGIGAGLRHGGQDIGQPRSGDHKGHAGFARHAGIAIGHKAAALFVPRRHVADA